MGKGTRKARYAILLLAMILGSTLAFLPVPVHAAPAPMCGSTITTSTTLNASIGPCPGNGLIIGANGITLNCAGQTIGGSGAADSIGISEITGIARVTVMNCNVTGFYDGFGLGSSSNTLIGNTANGNGGGFIIVSSPSSVLIRNTANGNGQVGFFLVLSSSNTLIGNTASDNNVAGFLFVSTSSNTLIGNTANSNSFDGFVLGYSSSNTLIGNRANSNNGVGFFLISTSSNILIGNAASGNGFDNFLLDSASATVSPLVTQIEYGLVAGLIAVVIIAAVTTAGTDLAAVFNEIASRI